MYIHVIATIEAILIPKTVSLLAKQATYSYLRTGGRKDGELIADIIKTGDKLKNTDMTVAGLINSELRKEIIWALDLLNRIDEKERQGEKINLDEEFNAN